MKSVRLCAALLVVPVLLVAVAVSSAQEKKQGQRPGGRGGFGGMLLSAEPVQKELKLTEDQTKKIKEIADAAPRPDFAGLQNATPEERAKRGAEFAEKARETQKKAEEVLTADQKKRFKEITVQVRGLSDPEVVADLKLTDEQKSKIRSIGEDTQTKTRELFQGGANEGAREKMTQLRKESEEKTLAVLTADQKSQFEKMKGEKVGFDVAPLRGPGFGGGFFGRPGGTQKKNQ